MAEDRLPTHLWIDAHLKRCSVMGISAVVVNSGQKMGGSVLLKIYQPEVGCRLMSQMRDLDGKLSWYCPHKEKYIHETDADALIKKSISRDPDLWVIEIDTKDGKVPVENINFQ